MNENNRYAPPKAALRDTEPAELAGDRKPALWNPNAAASWSLIFTPAFGAYLHMLNWRALGDSQRAAASKIWVYVSLGMLVLFMVLAGVLPESKGVDGITRAVGFALLLSWYFQSAKVQVKLVKEEFGKDYPRKGWGKPIGIALLCTLGFIVLVFVSAVISEAAK
jgi:hypothetical protein